MSSPLNLDLLAAEAAAASPPVANSRLPAVDLTLGAPEKFPIKVFPPLLRDVAENLASLYQTPVCLPAMSVLAVESGAVGKSICVRGAFKDKLTRLNIYVFAAAERGSGKGNIGETLCALLARRSKELAEHHNTQAIADEVDRKVTLLVDDATSEALGRALADNGEQVFSYSSEAGAAVQVALGKYSAKGHGDYHLLLAGYSGDAVRTNRITRKDVQLDNPCLAILWMFQVCIAREILGDPAAMDRGLTARPLMFDSGARREYDDRRTLTFDQGPRWSQFLGAVLDHRLSNVDPVEITCSAEAREVFAKFNDESVDLERGPFADFAGELSRWRENAIKIAGLFAVAEHMQTISSDLAARACAVMRWCGHNYLGLLHSGRDEKKRRDLEHIARLLESNGGEKAVGKLAASNGIDRDQLDALVAAFPSELEIERRKQPGRGKPAEIVRLKK